jgi:hypothetical protein
MKMYKSLYLLAAIIAVLSSCAKDVNTLPPYTAASGHNIIGAWNFVALKSYTISTSSTMIGKDESSNVAILDYTTIRNGGILAINGDRIISYGMTYAIDTVMKLESYVNGKKQDGFSMPFTWEMPATNSTSYYFRKGIDSLYFTGALMVTPGMGGGTTPVAPSTAKIDWAGDTLLLIAGYSNVIQQEAMGMIVKQDQKATVTLKFIRR